MPSDDPVRAAVEEFRRDVKDSHGRGAPRRLADKIAPALLAAVDAALSHHRRVPLYGNASTEDEPDACPHDPDSDLHFDDGNGEWLCEGKPEGAVCSCTESPDGEQLPYPCDEVTDILAALTGETPADALARLRGALGEEKR